MELGPRSASTTRHATRHNSDRPTNEREHEPFIPLPINEDPPPRPRANVSKASGATLNSGQDLVCSEMGENREPDPEGRVCCTALWCRHDHAGVPHAQGLRLRTDAGPRSLCHT